MKNLRLRYLRWRLSKADEKQQKLIERLSTGKPAFAGNMQVMNFRITSEGEARQYVRNQTRSALFAAKIAKAAGA